MTSFERGFERPFDRYSNGFERLCFAHPPYPPYRSKGFEGPSKGRTLERPLAGFCANATKDGWP